MNTKARKLLTVLMTQAAMAAVWTAAAPAPARAADEDEDRPVARLSLLEGDVSVRLGDTGDWIAAAVNAPVLAEDTVATPFGARAEIQLDWANMVRLGADTELRLAELENERYIVQLARGLITFRVQRESAAEVEISTPVVSVRPMRVGSYRVFVREDGVCEITVRSGLAEVFTPTGSETLRAGQTMVARGTASYPEFRIGNAAARDDWDRWNEERDRYFERSEAYQYVDSSVYGAEDLDGHGSWVYADPYGWVWTPTVQAGWTPYYDGRWVWIDWYGWNWVSYEPWGWAPYHYGRWFYHNNRWCWWPGTYGVRHRWSPGLVAFVGWGGWNGVSVGVGLGQIGWIPLAPYETYYPWYGRGYYGGYRGGVVTPTVRVSAGFDVAGAYRNARVANAITGIDAGLFGRGGGVRHLRIEAGNLRRGDLVRGPLPVVPERESMRFKDRPVAPPRAAEARNDRVFVSRRAPKPVERVPFDVQRRSIEQTVRRPLGEGQGPAAGRPGTPEPGRGTGARPAVPAENGGWRRIGEPRMRDPEDRPAAPPVRDRDRNVPQIRVPAPDERRATPAKAERPPEAPRPAETPRPAPPAAERERSNPVRIAPQIVRERPERVREAAPPPPPPQREAAPAPQPERTAPPSGGGERRSREGNPRSR